jgi:hypothetical protein
MGSKLLIIPDNDRIEINSIIAEEQLGFVLSVLLISGIPEQKLEACLTNGEFSLVANKIAFRKLCEKEQISIVDDTTNGLKIYVKSEDKDILIAEWYQPSYNLRIKARKLFTEIHLRWWMFEEK